MPKRRSKPEQHGRLKGARHRNTEPMWKTKPRRKREVFEGTDCFAVRLADSTYAIGQVLGRERDAMDSILCAFSTEHMRELPTRGSSFDLADKIIAVLFVTPELLDSGAWSVIGPGRLLDPERYIPLRMQRKARFIGTTIVGAGNVKCLLDAYHGLYPWNGFAIPNYLDGLLLSPELKPKDVVYR